MEYGVWSMEYGVWSMEYLVQQLASLKREDKILPFLVPGTGLEPAQPYGH